VQRGLVPKYLPRDPRGGHPQLSAAEVVTMLVWGAWRGLSEQSKLYYHLLRAASRGVPSLGSYRKFVEATTRYTVELRGLLALILAHNRQVTTRIRVVFQDSTALPVCQGSFGPVNTGRFRPGAQVQNRQWLVVWLQGPCPVRRRRAALCL